MEKKDPITLAQLIVRGTYINFNNKTTFDSTSGIYRFTNEDITSYFHHLENKEKVLTVISSGNQIINSILAGTRELDCFDISIFPEYYLYLQLASIMTLSKEDYLKYYFSDDREEFFCDDLYDRIREKLNGKYRDFWDSLYNFNESIDIYESLLFRHDIFYKDSIIEKNPYLQDDNYEKLKHILQTESLRIKTYVADILKTSFKKEYDLVNLSNILSYYFRNPNLEEYIEFLKTNFSLSDKGEIINYIFKMSQEQIDVANKLLAPNGYVEDINGKKLLVYKKDDRKIF